ncbi:MAG: very short patch repair endonuclease [bacterium]
MDTVSPQQRSSNMSAVRNRNTVPERTVRSLLHRMGLRFRLHQSQLPGSPDIVLKRHNTALFVHGCFWHGHTCPRGMPPSTRVDFWLPKLARNRERDEARVRLLRRMGWRVMTVWECETKDEAKLVRRLARWFRQA